VNVIGEPQRIFGGNSLQGRQSSNVRWKSTKSAVEDGVPVGNSHWNGNSTRL